MSIFAIKDIWPKKTSSQTKRMDMPEETLTSSNGQATTETATPLAAPSAAASPPIPGTRSKKGKKQRSGSARRFQSPRPYPRATLEECLKVPYALKEKNGGNPWDPTQIAKAVGLGKGNPDFWYLTAASRDFGFTEGTRDTAEIKLLEPGRRLVYAPDKQTEAKLKMEAFLRIAIFRGVLEHYRGSKLPEMTYLANVLEDKFKLPRDYHEEFADLFKKNCEYLGIGETFHAGSSNGATRAQAASKTETLNPDVETVAEPETSTGLTCFVVMPFTERDPSHPPGFFNEVLQNLIAPAAKAAGFRVVTAKRKGSDIIQATIVNGVLDADLVIADLTEHNPNVLMELGMRMAEDKPVALIKAMGTGAVFDVDNMLRVESYDANLWPSTVQVDLPKLTDHIRETWENREKNPSFLKILRKQAAAPQG